jgi:hypothetical protein
MLDYFRSNYEEAGLFNPLTRDNNFSSSQQINSEINTRFQDLLHLRLPTKNSITAYNALQKVFRARFDEGRSLAKLNDLSNSSQKQPLLASSRLPYEKLLGKNKFNFISYNFFEPKFNFFDKYHFEHYGDTNTYFFDFPFLLGTKSDASKYV